MSENQFKYGTSYSSVRVHQKPGGNSTFSLGWGAEEERKSVPEPAKVVPPAEEENQEEELRRQEELKRAEELRKKEDEDKKKKEEEAKAATKSRVPPGGKTSFSFY